MPCATAGGRVARSCRILPRDEPVRLHQRSQLGVAARQEEDAPHAAEGLELAEYARDKQLAKMAEVREVADALELIVADDL